MARILLIPLSVISNTLYPSIFPISFYVGGEEVRQRFGLTSVKISQQNQFNQSKSQDVDV